MKKLIGLTILVVLTLVGARASAQQTAYGGSPIRRCIIDVDVVARRESAGSLCDSFAGFQARAAQVASCQSLGNASAVAGPHFCGVCVVRTGRVIVGCEPYINAQPPPIVVSPPPAVEIDAGVEATVASPDAGVPDVVPEAAPNAMDAAVAPMDAAAVPQSVGPQDPACPPVPDAGRHRNANVRCVNIQGFQAPDGYAVVVMPITSADGGAPNGAIELTPESACRASGGFWDSSWTVPMERGRQQRGFCFTVEMQAYTRAVEGRGDDITAEQLLVLIRNRRDAYVRESRLQEVADAGVQAIAAEREERGAQVNALNDNATAIGHRVDEVAARDQETRDTFSRYRQTRGFDVAFYGGGSIMIGFAPVPAFTGLLFRGNIPLLPRLSFSVGVGMGAGFPLDERGSPHYHFLQTAGLQYTAVGEERVTQGNRDALVFSRHGLVLGGGFLGSEMLGGLDFNLHALTLGFYLEAGYSLRITENLRFRASALGAIGHGYRSTPQWTGGFFPDVLIMGTLGLEAHF